MKVFHFLFKCWSNNKDVLQIVGNVVKKSEIESQKTEDETASSF